MNSYKITLGSGSRTIQGKDINEAFKSLGYQNNFKVYPNGFNKFRIELEGSKGHESTYYAEKLNYCNKVN